MSDKETLQVYADKVQDYAKMVNEGAQIDPYLRAFIALVGEAGHVLDLGCGPGTSAHRMADAGLSVTATDAVPEMIALADAHPGVKAKIATFDDIEGIDIYDGIWANFSLLHAERAKMPNHLSALKTALKPGGVFHIALKSGTGSKRDSLGRYYTYYTDSELTGLLEGAGFIVTDRASGTEAGLDGVAADWIALRAHG